MGKIKEMMTFIDLDYLLKIFDIQIAIGILIFFVIFRSIFSKIIIKLYYKIIKCKKNPKESSMYRPFKNFFIILGIYLMFRILLNNSDDDFILQALYIINKVFKLIVIYYIFKLLGYLVTEDSVISQKVFRDPTNTTVNKFLCKIGRMVLWVVYGFIVIAECGYDLNGLLTALGLGSAAIALAGQDLVKSLISGVTILTDKPFVIGDWVEVGTYQGTVIDITFRSTRIKAYNNAVITIPNSTITSTYIVNWNRLTTRRFDCVLNLSLDTSSEKIKKIVKEIRFVLENNPIVLRETVEVSLDEITSCSSNIKIFLYVKEADYSRYLKVKQDILCSLLFLIEKENIELAYPTQTLYLRKDMKEE